MKNNNKASIFIYILLLVSIALVLGLVVFNNSITLTNNLNIGKNSEEVFNNLSDKAEVTIDTVRKYNNNGGGFSNGISCPTNVTMSGSTSSGTHISTSMVNNYGSIYCSGNYNGDEFRIYFNETKTDFSTAYYKGDIVNIIYATNSVSPHPSTDNIADNASKDGWQAKSGTSINGSADNNLSTKYKSKYRYSGNWWTGYHYPYLKYTFSNLIAPGKIVIKKISSSYWKNWDSVKILFYDSSGNEIDYNDRPTINNARDKTLVTKDLSYRGLSKDVKSIYIWTAEARYLHYKEIEIYELEGGGTTNRWEGDRKFNDSDNTFISFTDEGVSGGDLIDDNLNSDDYTVGSTRRADGSIVYYGNGYQDDDVIPRKIIFGNVPAKTNLYNIFWNNYKTVDFIDKNINNNDILNIKMGLVSTGALYLDLYTLGNYNYDLKILEFNRDDYKNKYTLLPISTSFGKNLNDFVGYIQKSSTGILSLSRYKTGNEYKFNFSVKDYGIYISNHDSENLSYRISGEVITNNISDTGSGIYINPIDDSATGTISVMSNHMIIGGEKNFIGENFVVTDAK